MSKEQQPPGVLERRRTKLITFIVAEVVALGVLALSGTVALSGKHDALLLAPANIITLAAAVAVAVIPILFFAIAPVLPSGDR